MTPEEIDKIFPNEYGGNAQISDLRLLLSKLASSGVFESTVNFDRVHTISDMQALSPTQGDICLVEYGLTNEPETYIFDDNNWELMVLNSGGGGGGSSYPKKTDQFIIDSNDVAFKEIALTFAPVLGEHLFVFLNGILLREGSSEEFTISGNIITFSDDVIYENDSVVVKYSYAP